MCCETINLQVVNFSNSNYISSCPVEYEITIGHLNWCVGLGCFIQLKYIFISEDKLFSHCPLVHCKQLSTMSDVLLTMYSSLTICSFVPEMQNKRKEKYHLIIVLFLINLGLVWHELLTSFFLFLYMMEETTTAGGCERVFKYIYLCEYIINTLNSQYYV